MSLDKFVTASTQHGPVKGDRRTTFLGVDYVNFQGIPYMKAPLGELRFRAPVKPEKWTEAFDATKECPSFPNIDSMFGKVVGIEDGGRVNVMTKNLKPNNLYPVLIYVSLIFKKFKKLKNYERSIKFFKKNILKSSKTFLNVKKL
jgi:cholinesterase